MALDPLRLSFRSLRNAAAQALEGGLPGFATPFSLISRPESPRLAGPAAEAVLVCTADSQRQEFRIGAGTYSVGGMGCDFVAPGADADVIFLVSLVENRGALTATLDVRRDEVSLDASMLKPGDNVPVRAGEVVGYHGLGFHLEGVDGAAPGDLLRNSYPSRRWGAAILLFAASFVLIALWALSQSPRLAVDPDIRTSVGATSPSDPQTALRDLNDTLRLAGIPAPAYLKNDVIVVDSAATQLTTEQRKKLDQVIAEVSAATHQTVSDAVSLGDGIGRYIAAVSYGSRPFVVGQDGRRYSPGSVLPGGWLIVSIGGNDLVVRRGQEEHNILLP